MPFQKGENNVAKRPDIKKKISKKSKEYFSNSKTKTQHSEIMKSDKVRTLISKRTKVAMQRKEVKEKLLKNHWSKSDKRDEIIKKISEKKKGKKLSEEHKKKLSESLKGEKNPFYGKIHSKKTKKIISQKASGRIVSKETRQKISEVHKGRKHTGEALKNIREAGKRRRIRPEFIDVECLYCGKVKTHKYQDGLRRTFCDNKCSSKYLWTQLEYRNKCIKGLHKSPNKTEKRLIKVIEKYNLPFKFVGNYSFFIKRKNPDFIHLTEKMLIEVNGDFFVHTQRDVEEKTEFYHQHDWKVLNLTDGEIEKSSIESLKEIVETFEQTGLELPIEMNTLDNYITKICEQCSKEYETKNKKRKYCCRECSSLSQRNRVTLICRGCSKEFKVKKYKFKTRKYCSYDCFNKSRKDTRNKKLY